MFNRIDNGRVASGFTNEKNDCCVLALVVACQIPYVDAHAKLKEWGREDGKRTYGFDSFMDSIPYTEKGLRPNIGMTVGTFIKRHPVGRYVIRKRGHVFAIIDGVIHDTHKVKLGSSVIGFWRVG